MSQQKSQASNRPQQAASHRKDPDNAAREQEERDEANRRRFVDQSGVVAQDLPDGQHGQNAVPDADEMKRTLPQEHGGADGDEGGLRASMTLNDADRHGGRKRN